MPRDFFTSQSYIVLVDFFYLISGTLKRVIHTFVLTIQREIINNALDSLTVFNHKWIEVVRKDATEADPLCKLAPEPIT